MTSPDVWYSSLPFVTKYWFTSVIIMALLTTFNIVNNKLLALDYFMIFYYRQYWRLLTSYLFMGPISINFLFQMGMLIQYSRNIEEESYNTPRQRIGYLYILFLGWVLFTSIFLFVIPTSFPSTIMIVYIAYIWSRKDPFRPITFYGFTLKAWHAPFLFLLMDVLLGASILPSLIAILVGHIVHFMKDIVPMKYGQSRYNLFVCPEFLLNWSEQVFSDRPLSYTQREQQQQQQLRRPAWATGPGHRLG